MNCHQILTGAVNAGDHCYSVGSVEGIPFTAYAAGCNIVILASDFQRVQIIPGVCHGNIQVSCLDCSTDLGKIASAYGKQICVFEPTPLLDKKSSHHLDYRWVQTATFETDCYVHAISLNLEGSRLLTGGECIQMWHLSALPEEHIIQEEINFQINCDNKPIEDESKWDCIWKCKTAYPVSFLKFSPDGTLFASAGKADRLVKIWYGSGKVHFTSQLSRTSSTLNDITYTFIYLAHPRAVTGLSWRKSSKYMPRDSVANMLITSCRDNICRLWVQTLLPEDGLVNLQQQADAQSNQVSKQQSQRHKRRIMQQLKHMKSFSQYKRRQASQFTEDSHETIPTLPSTYSVHDFHSFGLQGSSVAPGVHFHLSASINAETDIPLVPTMIGRSSVTEPNFVIHWLNNKEMAYTQVAEHLLQEISRKLLQQEVMQTDSNHLESDDQENFSESVKVAYLKSSKGKKGFKPDYHESTDDEFISKQSDSIGSSSASIATDVSTGNVQVPFADTLDKKLDVLLRDWHQNVDILFSIHPIDGSFLIWKVHYLDECIPGAFRQAQVSFTFRIPNAIPLGDSATMSQQVYLYLPYSELDLRVAVRSSVDAHKQSKRLSEHSTSAEVAIITGDQTIIKEPNKKTSSISHQAPPTPIICMITKHNNGSFNLWHLTFKENSEFTQVLTIGHSSRVCGHRFRINDITCHPVLPLFLTTSHHNLPVQNSPTLSPQNHLLSGSCCLDSSLPSGFCSELILWKVDAVGPLSKSGGITELARLNSPKISAFANVAWIPTLLPSTTLGGISNSPSACFVASDGCQLRVYQAVIDARTLLAEISSSQRKKSEFDLSMSSSTSSGLGYRQSSLQETFRIVSLQSAARPGCIIELDAITDATHDWKSTQLLHIFQEQLITGHKTSVKTDTDKETEGIGLLEPSMQALVDLRHGTVFEEPFYLVVLEKDDDGTSVLHMWRILVASQFGHEENQNFSYIPDSNLIQEGAQSTHSSRSNSPEPPAADIHPSLPASPLQVTTTKICEQILPLPSDTEVIHATPAAGHLSSSNIYPACFAPYLICTACSDGTVRFWRCEVNNKVDSESNKSVEYVWVEWEMLLNRNSSAVHVSGQPLFVSSAYSGRLACAYKCGKSFMRPSSNNPDNRYVNLCISIFECESTGGSEWIQEDTIHLKNIILPQKELGISWDIAELFDVSLRNRRTADKLKQKLPSNEEFENEPLQRMLSVPSYTTLHILRRAISEQGNQCQLTQKFLVQLDWVSTEDGSHVLTVAVGSKVLLFTPVSTDIAQANVQAMKASKSASRPLLKQASSMAAPLLHAEEIRWMRIRTTYLSTSDGLSPLPMQISWVRDGILVVGMDNEMHIYSQWRPTCSDNEEGKVEEKDGETGIDSRNLKEQELLTRAQETSQLRLPGTGTGTLSRSTSYNILTTGGETKKKKEAQAKSSSPRDSIVSLGPLPDFGMFEASRFACPVLPQYHPKQLMEMLGFGKIRRVKAILSHLVRCLGGTENVKKTFLQVPETMESRDSESDSGARSWSRSRALSIAATSSPNMHSPLDQQGSISVFPEEVQLDYVEIQSIPPLPLFTLLAADSETHGSTPTARERDMSNQDYSGLFDTIGTQAEESLDDILDERFQLTSKREFGQSAAEEKSMLTQFGQRQAHLLTRLLTHSHLPGLSSLDQMHLLALADTVASFNTEFSDHFKTTKLATVKETVGQQEDKFKVSTDALDDCGLRFLLAMRHHIYLVRCLPLVQRTQLQYKGLGSHSMVWAFHSETQEELLQLIPTVQRGNPRWNELREVGIGWWVRSNTVLRRIMEKVAKAAFQVKSDPLDAALFYLAMKKKNVVWGLFRSIHENKMTQFFQHNFTEDKWRKSALKNAFALLGKQRFHHAAAFFLLAGAVKDAVDVCLTKLDDFQLAMVIIRLYEGELDMNTPGLRRLLFEEILGCDADGSNYQSTAAHPDPFLRSMAHWMLQDYSGALKTLVQTDVGHSHPKAVDDSNKATSDDTTVHPSVFNFYLYLRTHPLVVRGQIAQNAEVKRKALKSSLAKTNDGSRKIAVQGLFEDAITPLERRLFFTTAHAHFRAGCPALALEVLSRLPNHILPDSDAFNGDMYSPTLPFSFNVTNVDSTIQSGALPNGDIPNKVEFFDWSQPVSTKTDVNLALDLDWSTPISIGSVKSEPLNTKSEDGSDEEMGIQMKTTNEELLDESVIKNKEAKLDIMAQQLKFIACLKIMMEELSTLATGFEVDGGQLRYQLYIWLERSVIALRDLCNYGNAYSLASDPEAAIGASADNCDISRDRHGSSSFRVDDNADAQKEKLPTLHEILLSDKLEFEAKLHRATRRKQWLKANESLLRTLLGYCSLHGAHGGGLAAVRMELILLLQELQQERSQQQLLSPLPFPTTLPLVAASVACQKTVIADPIRHLQAMIHDILLSIMEVGMPPFMTSTSYSRVLVLRDLGTSLSACIYQSLCDSDNFIVKQTSGKGLNMETFISSSVVYQNSHLLAGHVRSPRYSSSEETLIPSTQPTKWPGVQSLLALMARDKDEDSPKLHTLLCEAFFATYLSQLCHALATCDCHVLFRLVSQKFNENLWGMLFGGGAKRLLHVATAAPVQIMPVSAEKESPSGESGLLNSLSKQRVKLRMKLLGQLSLATTRSSIKEDRPTYREQFISPQMSMMSCFMSKPQLPTEWCALDYDSSNSIPSDDEDIKDEEGADDEVFDEVLGQLHSDINAGTTRKPKVSETMEQLDPSSYSWGILRYAIVKIAYCHLLKFLSISGIESPESPVTSQMILATLKLFERWLQFLKMNMDSFGHPPPNYIAGCFVENIQKGPAILKYKQLLDPQNTPFRSHSSALPVKRLWNYLVRQEEVQDIFIRYIFSRRLSHLQPLDDVIGEDAESVDGAIVDPIKIIHKDQDSVSAFCINNQNPGVIALATAKEIQELNISILLEPLPWLEDEAEYDILNISEAPESLPPTDYLVVHHPADKLPSIHGQSGSVAGSTYSSPTGSAPAGFAAQTGRTTTVMKGLHFQGSSNPQFCQFVLERSRHMLKPLKRHKTDGVRRLCPHPENDFYLSGSQDGSVHLWKWCHQQPFSSPRPSGTFAKVTKVMFNDQGNKFGVTDGDGNISLWQANMNSQPYFSTQCHSKQASDFVFVNSSSLIATAGHSTENRNVCMWDTLLPQRNSLVVSFNCHDNGSSAILYGKQNQLLITAGKKGFVCLFDIRQRQLIHSFQAHESPIKCLALEPSEEFFVTGASDGDIKVWSLPLCVVFYSFTGEHIRSTLFRNLSVGVSQVCVDSSGRLFSCGADGSMKLRTLPDRDQIVNTIY